MQGPCSRHITLKCPCSSDKSLVIKFFLTSPYKSISRPESVCKAFWIGLSENLVNLKRSEVESQTPYIGNIIVVIIEYLVKWF